MCFVFRLVNNFKLKKTADFDNCFTVFYFNPKIKFIKFCVQFVFQEEEYEYDFIPFLKAHDKQTFCSLSMHLIYYISNCFIYSINFKWLLVNRVTCWWTAVSKKPLFEQKWWNIIVVLSKDWELLILVSP